jgi:hypothetical protein
VAKSGRLPAPIAEPPRVSAAADAVEDGLIP